MKEKYLLLVVLGITLNTANLITAQIHNLYVSDEKTIENLSVFPNPVENGFIVITSKNNLPKTVEVYDILGKQVIATPLKSKTLNISRLSPGIYILKITQNKLTVTRKLVVR